MKTVNVFRSTILFLAFTVPSLASADWIYFISRSSDLLQRVDTQTFEREEIGQVDFDYRWGGIAWDPEAKKLLVINDPSAQVDDPKLYLVDPFTAGSSLVGTVKLSQSQSRSLSASQPYGLEYIADSEQLLLSFQSRVVEIDRGDLSVSEISDSESSSNQFGGLAFDSDTGWLYTTDSDGSAYRINMASGSITLDCPTNQLYEGGIAYDPVQQAFWQTRLVGIDNHLHIRVMGPQCGILFKASGVGNWAENLTYVPETDLGFGINSYFSDAWFNPLTNGQGFMIAVLPDQKLMFVTWFTYDVERPPEGVTAILGEPGHRWLTAQGPYEGDTANLEIALTSGGVFDSATPPATTDPEAYGTMTVQFADCENGMIEYEIPALELKGEIPIERVALDNVSACEASNRQ